MSKKQVLKAMPVLRTFAHKRGSPEVQQLFDLWEKRGWDKFFEDAAL
jgi:hypothetical protein